LGPAVGAFLFGAPNSPVKVSSSTWVQQACNERPKLFVVDGLGARTSPPFIGNPDAPALELVVGFSESFFLSAIGRSLIGRS
jgi:hypothetical protein